MNTEYSLLNQMTDPGIYHISLHHQIGHHVKQKTHSILTKTTRDGNNALLLDLSDFTKVKSTGMRKRNKRRI